MRPLANAGKEDLPNAPRAQTHGVTAVSESLKSPVTLTTNALGAQTANRTPATPRHVATCAPISCSSRNGCPRRADADRNRSAGEGSDKVLDLLFRSVPELDLESVRLRVSIEADRKQALGMRLRHRYHAVAGNNVCVGSLGKECPYFPALLHAVRAEGSKGSPWYPPAMASTSLGVTTLLLQTMNKAELHVHLEGSIEPEALLEIEPSLTREEIATSTAFDTFEGFIKAFIWVNKKLLTPEHYAIAARHLFARFEEQGITYAEITLSAGMILWKQQSLADVYEALWKESQKSRVKVFWIPDAIRQFGAEKGMEVGRFAVSRRNDGVVAFGIGGDELRGPRSGSRTSSATRAITGCTWCATPAKPAGRNPCGRLWRLERSALATESPPLAIQV